MATRVLCDALCNDLTSGACVCYARSSTGYALQCTDIAYGVHVRCAMSGTYIAYGGTRSGGSLCSATRSRWLAPYGWHTRCSVLAYAMS
eukprot:59399-Rhodomonas_salina.1